MFRRVVDAAKTAIEYPYAILGLGDVVIPGVFTSLMVFVDKELVFGDEREVSHVPNGPYFSTAVVAYVLGLITCFVANTATQRAQPALLYLVRQPQPHNYSYQHFFPRTEAKRILLLF